MNKVTVIEPADAFLIERASVIRALGKRMARDIIEIGRLLVECKERVGHGAWLPWLEREFRWSDKTAENFMNVASKFETVSNLSIDARSLYLLARPSTPDELRDEVIERAANGEAISHKEVARLIDEAREQDRFATEDEIERRLARERAKAEEREQEIRAEYDDKLVIDADELAAEIAKRNKPLHARIKKLERQLERHRQAEERRKRGTQPKINADTSLRATAITGRIGDLCAALTITPAQLIDVERATAEVTGQTLKARLKQDVAHAEATLAWLQQFLTAFREAAQ